jgi:hypothetical protein
VLSLFCSYNVFVVMKFVSSNLDTMGGRRVRVKTKGFIKPLALGFEFARTVRVFSSRAEGEGVRYGRMGGRKDGHKGGVRV